MPAAGETFDYSTITLSGLAGYPGGAAMFESILVAYDGSPSSRAAVRQAFELAQSANGDVTVVTVAPSVAPLAALGGVSVDQLHDELEKWSQRTAEEAAATAPDGVAVRAVERSGH